MKKKKERGGRCRLYGRRGWRWEEQDEDEEEEAASKRESSTSNLKLI